MKSRKGSQKNCSIGANCKSTCIDRDKNCLKESANGKVADAVSKIKIGSLGFSFLKSASKTQPNKTNGTNQLFGQSLIGGLGQIKGVGETGVKFAPKKAPEKITRVADNFAMRVATLNVDGKTKLGSGAFGTVYDDGKNVIKQLKNFSEKIDIQRDVLNQNLAANLGLAPKVTAYTDREIKMDKSPGKSFYKSLNELSDKEVNTMIKAKSDIAVQLHRAGISHNDAHNENIFYDKATGKAQFLDFGLSQSNADPRLIFQDYKTYFESSHRVSYDRVFKTSEEYQAFLNQ